MDNANASKYNPLCIEGKQQFCRTIRTTSAAKIECAQLNKGGKSVTKTAVTKTKAWRGKYVNFKRLDWEMKWNENSTRRNCAEQVQGPYDCSPKTTMVFFLTEGIEMHTITCATVAECQWREIPSFHHWEGVCRVTSMSECRQCNFAWQL